MKKNKLILLMAIAATSQSSHAIESQTAEQAKKSKHQLTLKNKAKKPSSKKISPQAQRIKTKSAAENHRLHGYPTNKKLLEAPKGLVGNLGLQSAVENCSIELLLTTSNMATSVPLQASSCLNDLYSIDAQQAGIIFSDDNLNKVADELKQRAATYNGVGEDGVLQLVTYLRAGLYSRYTYQDSLGDYPDATYYKMVGASQALFSNPKTYVANAQNGDVLSEAIILIDSLTAAEFHLDAIKKIIDTYGNDYGQHKLEGAFTSLLTLLYNSATYNDDYNTAIANNPIIVNALNDFLLRNEHAMVGASNEYQLKDVMREMTRFMKYPALKPQVKINAISALNKFEMTGRGSSIWLGIAGMVNHFDGDNCQDYGTCNYMDTYKSQILSIHYQCSDTLNINAQATYDAQNKWICNTLGEQETYFHQLLNTNKQANRDDYNAALELVIFDSYGEYDAHAGALFNMSTDNGGMYLEGTPSDIDNQARFIAHEAQWLKGDDGQFHVWNLQHEYVHYLDGRYNIFGGFNDSTSYDVVWWVEGLAEYVSHRDGSAKALELAPSKAHKLSEIFKNSYQSSSDRIYHWGYLAVRFMFEQHRDDVDTITGMLREGQFEQYQAFMDNLGTSYDAQWLTWLGNVTLGASGIVQFGPSDVESIAIDNGEVPVDPTPVEPTPVEPTPSEPVLDSTPRSLNDGAITLSLNTDDVYNGIYIDVPENKKKLKFKFTGISGQVKVKMNYSAPAAKGSVLQSKLVTLTEIKKIVIKKPQAGRYYLTVEGKLDGSEIKLQAASAGDLVPAIDESAADPSVNETQKDIAKLNLSSSQGHRYFYALVPEGAARVVAKLKNGSGDATVYASTTNWPTVSEHEFVSARPDSNIERITIEAPVAGSLVYFAIQGDFEGAEFKVSFPKQ